jgi:hypothetical protein
MKIWQGLFVSAWWIGLLMLEAGSSLAQPATFGTLTLDGKKMSGVLTGSTGGATSLPAIVGNRDRHGRNCLGFGDPNPDHTLVLQKPASKLKLSVVGGSRDTTLVVAGPNGALRCGDSGSIEDSDWQTGTYQIWVGTVEPNKSRNYRLMVQGN